MIREYGQITGCFERAMIPHCFQLICKRDEDSLLKNFQTQNPDQAMHTFTELVMGAYLSSKGLRVRYDREIDDKRPDWSILEAEGESITGIVELTNFHIDKATNDDMGQQMCMRQAATYWSAQIKDKNLNRLYHVIRNKSTAYKSLIDKRQVPFVVGVVLEFRLSTEFEDVLKCILNHEQYGLFCMYKHLSGVLYFREVAGQYSFEYAGNQNATCKLDLPEGVFGPGAD